MRKVTKKQLSDYKNRGFIVIPDTVPRNLIDNLFVTVKSLLQKYDQAVGKRAIHAKTWSDHLFHQTMIDLRNKDSRQFGILYDAVQTSSTLQQLMGAPQIVLLAAELLSDSLTGISITSHMLRMDAPRDTRNSLDWHQDSAYFIQNLRGEHGAVCWIPMQEISAKNGGVKLCLGSQKEGIIRIGVTKGQQGSSDQYKIPKSYIEKYPVVDISAKVGDVAFFNMDIIHRSGINSTDHIRFTAGARYHRMLTPDFLPGRFAYIPNEFVKSQRERLKIS